MPDHINIHHPQSREARMRHAIEVAKIKARISVMAGYIADMEIDLTAIFTRIERGDPVSFYYPRPWLKRPRSAGATTPSIRGSTA